MFGRAIKSALVGLFAFWPAIGLGQSPIPGSVVHPSSRPITIFVPGILGSRLISDGTVVWGAVSTRSLDLFYTRGEEYDSELLDKFEIFGIDVRSQTYGTYFESKLSDLTSTGRFFPFSYDWRSSIVDSAARLDQFICKTYSEQINHLDGGVQIIAHSMGGLVTKLWLKDYYDRGCGKSEKVPLDGILFVGTPHYGSPKAVQAVIFGVEFTGIRPVSDILTSDLNKYGVTFDSIYELFPFSHSYLNKFGPDSMCFDDIDFKEGNPSRIRFVYREAGREFYEIVDIYDSTILQRFGVGKKIERLVRESPHRFLTTIGSDRLDLDDAQSVSRAALNYLSDKLNRARKTACDLADFKLPSELAGKVYNISGKITRRDGIAEQSTLNALYVFNWRNEYFPQDTMECLRDTVGSGEWCIYGDMKMGDGTVPLEVARGFRGEESEVINASHLDLLSAVGFGDLLEELEFAEAALMGTEFALADLLKSRSDPVVALGMDIGAYGSEPKNEYFSASLLDAEIVENDKLLLDGLKTITLSDVKRKSGFSEGTLGADIWPIIVSGDYETAEEIFMFAEAGKKSPEDWHVIAALSDLEGDLAARAEAYAAAGYLSDGNIELASNLFTKASYTYGELPPSVKERHKDLAAYIELGGFIVNDYAGRR